MKKHIRQWIKEEKRIIKLLFQKGWLDRNCPALKDMYWANYRRATPRPRRSSKEFRSIDYLPEIHYSSWDYWGEWDEHAIIPEMVEGLHWANLIPDSESYDLNGGWGKSTFKYKSRKWFIKYLKALPTVNRSSKINRLLIRNKEQ